MEFPKGIRWVNPHEKAPDFIKGKLSLKIEEFIPYLQENAQNGWVNLQVKKSQKGIMYLELDTWQPTSSQQAKEMIEDEVSQEKVINYDDENGADEVKVENIPF